MTHRLPQCVHSRGRLLSDESALTGWHDDASVFLSNTLHGKELEGRVRMRRTSLSSEMLLLHTLPEQDAEQERLRSACALLACFSSEAFVNLLQYCSQLFQIVS